MDTFWNARRAREMAGIIVKAIRQAGGPSLDYSEGSIVLLDQEIPRGWPDPTAMSSEIAHGIGCYFGELLVRNLGGSWADGTNEPTVNFEGGAILVVSRTQEKLAEGGDLPLANLYGLTKAMLQQGMIRPSSQHGFRLWR